MTDDEGEPMMVELGRLTRFAPAWPSSPADLSIMNAPARGLRVERVDVRAARAGPATRQTRSSRARLSTRSTNLRSLSLSTAWNSRLKAVSLAALFSCLLVSVSLSFSSKRTSVCCLDHLMRPRVPCTCQSGCLIIPVDCGTVLVCSTSIRSTTPLTPLDQSNPEPRECGTGSTYRWKCLKKSERF